MSSRLPFGGGFMQGGRSPIGRAIETIGSAFAQHFMQQGQLQMQQGLNAQEQAKTRRAEVEALLESPDGPQDEAARRNLTMYMNSLDEVITADPRRALELFEQTESIGVEIPKLEQTNATPSTRGRQGLSAGATSSGGPQAETTGQEQRTVFEQVDVNRYVADLARQEAVDARARQEGLLSDQEQLNLYTGAATVVEEMVQTGSSPEEIDEYILSLQGLKPAYTSLLRGRAGVGRIVNMDQLAATNPTHLASLVQAAKQPNGSIDYSQLPEGWDRQWIQEHLPFINRLIEQDFIEMEGARLGLEQQTATTTAAFLMNDQRRQDLRQGELNIEQLENSIFSEKFTDSTERVQKIIETGLGYNHHTVSDSEREQVDQALASQGVTIEGRQRSFLTKVREMDREVTLRNALAESNIALSDIQFDAAQYSLNRTRAFGEIQDDATLVSVAVNASRTGDVATLQRYQNYLRDPAHADKAQRLRAAGVNPAMLQELLRVATEVKGDEAAQRQHNAELRNAELQRVLVQGVEDTERTAATIASTFDSEADARAYFETNPQQAEMLSSLGVLPRVYSDARYNDLKQGEQELWRDVELMTAERPDDIDAWNRTRYEQLLIRGGVSREVAQARAQGIIDAWRRSASDAQLQNEKDRAQMDLWSAQADAALKNAQANLNNSQANRTRADTEATNANRESAQTAFENSLNGLQELRQQQDNRRQTMMSEAQTRGCLITDTRDRLVFNPNADPEGDCGKIAADVEALGNMQDVVGQQIWELTTQGAGLFLAGGIDTANPQEFASTSTSQLVADVFAAYEEGAEVLPRQWAALVARLGEAEASRLIEEKIAASNNSGGTALGPQ